MMAEKTKKKLEEAAQSGSIEAVIDPPSPIRPHASQGSFVPHGHQDVLTAAIGRPEYPGRVHAAGAGVTIKQYFGLAPRTSRTSSSMAPEELEQLTQQIGDQLEELITEKVDVEEVKDADAPIPIPIDEVMWDATVFGLFNQDFPLYIKHEDLSEIAHDGQCLSISVIQLWILPNNYLKGIINRPVLFSNTFALALLSNINIVMFLVFNSALKELDDTPQPNSEVGDRWIVVKYFDDVRPLEAERLKALRIQWAQYYLKVRNQT
ncbi:hypothetical protein GmHk_13G036553 [Glycine max]|nr:hypothetical protein GmHk_13G036553 [Glycine max]